MYARGVQKQEVSLETTYPSAYSLSARVSSCNVIVHCAPFEAGQGFCRYAKGGKEGGSGGLGGLPGGFGGSGGEGIVGGSGGSVGGEGGGQLIR